MRQDDSRHEGGGEQRVGRNGKRRGVAFEVRRLWRDFKDFVPKALRVGDQIGEVVLDAGRLLGRAGGLLVRYSGRVAGGSALVGLTSPLTGGWGLEFLSGSKLATWAPVAALPSLTLLARVILASFGPLDREGERDAQRQQVEREEPDLYDRLAHEAETRGTINQRLKGIEKAPPIEDRVFVDDELAETAFQLKVRGLSDITLILSRWRRRGLKEVAGWGPVDDVVRGRLAGLDWEDITNIDCALRRALDPLEYSHAAVAFTTGHHHYLLLGIAGTVIPGHARLTISHAATRLVKRYVTGDQLPAAIGGELKRR